MGLYDVLTPATKISNCVSRLDPSIDPVLLEVLEKQVESPSLLDFLPPPFVVFDFFSSALFLHGPD